MTILQGVIAGGTTAYFRQAIQASTRERTKETWQCVALQANHLFHLVNMVLTQVSVQWRWFSLCSKGMYFATPVILLTSFYKRALPITPLQASLATHFNRFYYAVSIASSVALLALGSQAFAIASLSMVAIDFLSQGEVKEIFSYAAKTAAVFAFLGYGAWIMESKSLLAKISLLATGGLFFASKTSRGPIYAPPDPPVDGPDGDSPRRPPSPAVSEEGAAPRPTGSSSSSTSSAQAEEKPVQNLSSGPAAGGSALSAWPSVSGFSTYRSPISNPPLLPLFHSRSSYDLPASSFSSSFSLRSFSAAPASSFGSSSFGGGFSFKAFSSPPPK